jgi:hypothetical protein
MRALLSIIIVLAVVLTVMVAIPFALLATAFWAADGSWDFEGRGFKYWMFVQGTRLERLGTVEPTSALKYSISLGEGNFPGWNIVSYESAALPEKIISFYGERCTKLNLRIIENKSEQKPNSTRAEMTCEIEKYLDVEILAERETDANVSKVFLKVWGSE